MFFLTYNFLFKIPELNDNKDEVSVINFLIQLLGIAVGVGM
jgi:hypothetical protein